MHYISESHLYFVFTAVFICMLGVGCSSRALKQLLNTPVQEDTYICIYLYITCILLLSSDIILLNVFHDLTRKKINRRC